MINLSALKELTREIALDKIYKVKIIFWLSCVAAILSLSYLGGYHKQMSCFFFWVGIIVNCGCWAIYFWSCRKLNLLEGILLVLSSEKVVKEAKNEKA